MNCYLRAATVSLPSHFLCAAQAARLFSHASTTNVPVAGHALRAAAPRPQYMPPMALTSALVALLLGPAAAADDYADEAGTTVRALRVRARGQGPYSFPTPERQTAVQLQVMRKVQRAAPAESASATANVLTFLDTVPFRAHLRQCCPGVAGMQAAALYDAFKAEVGVMEMVHNWDPVCYQAQRPPADIDECPARAELSVPPNNVGGAPGRGPMARRSMSSTSQYGQKPVTTSISGRCRS